MLDTDKSGKVNIKIYHFNHKNSPNKFLKNLQNNLIKLNENKHIEL